MQLTKEQMAMLNQATAQNALPIQPQDDYVQPAPIKNPLDGVPLNTHFATHGAEGVVYNPQPNTQVDARTVPSPNLRLPQGSGEQMTLGVAKTPAHFAVENGRTIVDKHGVHINAIPTANVAKPQPSAQGGYGYSYGYAPNLLKIPTYAATPDYRTEQTRALTNKAKYGNLISQAFGGTGHTEFIVPPHIASLVRSIYIRS